MIRFIGVNTIQKIIASVVLFFYPTVFSPTAMGDYATFASYLTIFVVIFFGPLEALAGRIISQDMYDQKHFIFMLQIFLIPIIVVCITLYFFISSSNPILTEELILLLIIAVILTGFGKVLFRGLRFQNKRQAEMFIWRKLFVYLVIIGTGFILMDPDAIIYATTLSFTLPIIFAIAKLQMKIKFSSLFKWRAQKPLLVELLLLYPNRIFGMTVLPTSTLLIAESLGSLESGKYFLVLSILNSAILILSVIPEEIQKQFYTNNSLTFTDLLSKPWFALTFIFIVLSLIYFTELSSILSHSISSAYWRDVIGFAFVGLPFLYLSLLKVCHIGLFLSDPRSSRYLVLSTFVFWLGVISQASSFTSISECIHIICLSRLVANVFALLILLIIQSKFTPAKITLFILNAISIMII